MEYNFLDKSLQIENIILPDSDEINSCLLKNNNAEIKKVLNFISSNEKILHLHGFMGTGKRQLINYVCEFLDKEVIKLECYCREATVCDDILLDFTEKIDKLSISKNVNINTKITTLNVKLKQQILSIKKPFLIILHSFDSILEENVELIKNYLIELLEIENIKLIITSRAMMPTILNNINIDKKIFLKALSKDIFRKFIESNNLKNADMVLNDFYKYTRGYYYYIALTVKIIQAMKVDLNEFLQKFNQSGIGFDSYLGITYINLLPNTIRNFFWFLRTVRHGLTLNALAELELYDEFSIEYLKTNLMIFEINETLFVHDYFLQKIDISIPQKTQIKLHKYILGIYETQLKVPVKERSILISRQAMRAEIEYHNACISELQNETADPPIVEKPVEEPATQITVQENKDSLLSNEIEKAKRYTKDKKYTEAIEAYKNILDMENVDLITVIDSRLQLANLYKLINENSSSLHYYELVEIYYKQHKEFINLNYLYYEMADLYYKMYKHNRAIETIKKVIYSVDTPQSLMVNACTLLGNIYLDMNNYKDAYDYYQKAIESLDENVDKSTLSELYFKFALVNDEQGEDTVAFDFYNKCIAINENNSYKALSYSNLGSCYLESENLADSLACFTKAYDIEKQTNNYDGIYYNSVYIAKIHIKNKSNKALNFLIEAKKSAEFINEEFYILEASIALGDYYYNNKSTHKEALIEYLKARTIAEKLSREIDLSKITQRINDMKLRMNEEDFWELEKKYAK